ncbi:hypothetical protein [Halopseudomonas sp.]|uniref:hypothetical protein n=1 Tax=Halopseudomonas sp. TaxID=2901191 RepID=UPI00311D94DA
MNGIHEDDYSAIGTQHEQVTGRINDMLVELQNHAYATGVERGKELAAIIQAGTIPPTLCQTIHLGQPGVTVEPCLMLGPDEEEVACLLFTAPGTEVRLTWPTQTQALAVLAAATAVDCIEADAQPVACECGDSYPPGSYGAGFIEGRGHCANCAAGAGEMASLLGVSPAPVVNQQLTTEPGTAVPLAARHYGMCISAHGLLARVGGHLKGGAREMLKHLEEMATRYYAGDIAAVDEFLQLYCLDERRPEQLCGRPNP